MKEFLLVANEDLNEISELLEENGIPYKYKHLENNEDTFLLTTEKNYGKALDICKKYMNKNFIGGFWKTSEGDEFYISESPLVVGTISAANFDLDYQTNTYNLIGDVKYDLEDICNEETFFLYGSEERGTITFYTVGNYQKNMKLLREGIKEMRHHFQEVYPVSKTGKVLRKKSISKPN